MKNDKFYIFIITLLVLFCSHLQSIQAEDNQQTIVYFYSPTCASCIQVNDIVQQISEEYSNVQILKYNCMDNKNQLLRAKYDQTFEVSEEKESIVPAVFIGDYYLVGLGDIKNKISEALRSPTPTPVFIEGDSGSSILFINRFKSFGFGALVLAGLLDGINPCAFSTLMFFISYLLVTNKKGKVILFVGSSFTFGIFTAYLLLGMGIMHVFLWVEGITSYIKLIYPVMAIFITIIAIISFFDYLKFKRKRSAHMILKLPKKIIALINTVVRKLMSMKFLIPVSFLTGILISFLEFMCTGQVYLPTIVYIMGVPELKVQGLLSLIVYNIAFVSPMIVIFIVAYRTNTSKVVADFIYGRLKEIKLLLTILFVGLAIYFWIYSLHLL